MIGLRDADNVYMSRVLGVNNANIFIWGLDILIWTGLRDKDAEYFNKSGYKIQNIFIWSFVKNKRACLRCKGLKYRVFH